MPRSGTLVMSICIDSALLSHVAYPRPWIWFICSILCTTEYKYPRDNCVYQQTEFFFLEGWLQCGVVSLDGGYETAECHPKGTMPPR